MPLGPSGREVKAEMQGRYGADKGDRVFYASMEKKPKFKAAMHRKGTRRKVSRGR